MWLFKEHGSARAPKGSGGVLTAGASHSSHTSATNSSDHQRKCAQATSHPPLWEEKQIPSVTQGGSCSSGKLWCSWDIKRVETVTKADPRQRQGPEFSIWSSQRKALPSWPPRFLEHRRMPKVMEKHQDSTDFCSLRGSNPRPHTD